MHELSIAQSICDIIIESLGEAQPLSKVHVTIGPLSGIAPEALDFCFSEVVDTRMLGKPELIMNKPRAHASCKSCGKTYAVQDMYAVCPDCGSFDRSLQTGFEFTVDSVETLEE
ncbi:MAG: hypothetical protein GF398_06185 [Chitinivibrionales bacterium]|nr:hypothetical protein [Chitinivibrionales bacterium]